MQKIVVDNENNLFSSSLPISTKKKHIRHIQYPNLDLKPSGLGSKILESWTRRRSFDTNDVEDFNKNNDDVFKDESKDNTDQGNTETKDYVLKKKTKYLYALFGTVISCKENFKMCLSLSFHNNKIVFKARFSSPFQT